MQTFKATGQLVQTANRMSQSSDQTPAPGRVLLTTAEEGNLRYAFELFDIDRSGDLSQGEIIKLCMRLNLVGNKEDGIEMMRKMDVNNDGSVDIIEFLDFVDNKCCSHSGMTEGDLKDIVRRRLKLGFQGTTWRSHANIAWMSNIGIAVMTSTVILGLLIYFRFVLVPLTMAYFLTFLIGPLMDYFYQRPLIYGSKAGCLVQHYPDDEAKRRWEGKNTGRKFPTNPLTGEPDRSDKDYPIPSRWLNPIEWRADEDPAGCPYCRVFQISGVECFNLGRLPFSLALIIALGSFCGILFGTLYLCALQMVQLTEDEAFMANARTLRDELRTYLKRDMLYIVTELEPSNSTASEITLVELFSEFSWAVDLVNNTALTLLLMLMLLGTRQSRTPEDLHREQTNPHSMSTMDKIEASIRNYIMLKTFVSALTGGLVMFTLWLLSVRLWLVWGVLTFIFNFIPNIGSLIAMFLPLSVILVDDSLDTFEKFLAFIIPAAIQGYVGNVLEPTLFGKSLNLTAISVFIALVLWSSLWGICGAILSVSLLGAFKIILDASDYPLAKQILYIIKDDNSIEELVESRGFDNTGSSLIEATLNIGDTMLSQHQGVQGTQWVAQRDGTSLPVSSHQSAGGFQRGGLGGAAASPQAPSPQQRPSAMHQTHHVVSPVPQSQMMGGRGGMYGGDQFHSVPLSNTRSGGGGSPGGGGGNLEMEHGDGHNSSYMV